jgi:hypothetical protein
MENSEKKFKVCRNCRNWMVTLENQYEGVCTSQNSMAPTAETVEAQFTCNLWEAVNAHEEQL